MMNAVNVTFPKWSTTTCCNNGTRFFSSAGKRQIQENTLKFTLTEELSTACCGARADGLSVEPDAISGAVVTMKRGDCLSRFFSRIDQNN